MGLLGRALTRTPHYGQASLSSNSLANLHLRPKGHVYTLQGAYASRKFCYRPDLCTTPSDTGYRAEAGGDCCPAFEQLGERYGPMDFSAIPIWRGGTLSLVSSFGLRVSLQPKIVRMALRFLQLHHEALTLATHATPEDAVAIHSDVGSRASMAIHFATFAGSEDEATYPVSLLQEACTDVNIEMDISKDRGLGVCDIGETVFIPVRSSKPE